jgi:bacteriorhodopsin
LKKEIFNYLKENISTLSYSKEIPSIFKYSKPQLFSILFTLGIFLWSLYYAVQIESGVVYELKGTAALGAIMYSIGLLGVFKVVLLFLLLIGISVYSLIKKIQSRSEIEQLSRNK